jgi:hypothetical protein
VRAVLDTLRRCQTPAGHVLEVRNLKISRAYRVAEGVNSGSAPAIPINCWNGAPAGHRDSTRELAPYSRLALAHALSPRTKYITEHPEWAGSATPLYTSPQGYPVYELTGGERISITGDEPCILTAPPPSAALADSLHPEMRSKSIPRR